jgi:hypothetical protein
MCIGTRACLLIVAIILSGCVGEVVTRPIAPQEVTTVGNDLHGVVGYRAMQVVEVSTLTQFSADGKTFTTNCVKAESKKIVTVPDQKHPLLVTYKHGILEGYVFGVTMNGDGVITGINSTSNPDQGKTISNLADAALNGAKIAGGGGPAGGAAPLAKSSQVPCNSTPTFDRYDPVSPLPGS